MTLSCDLPLLSAILHVNAFTQLDREPVPTSLGKRGDEVMHRTALVALVAATTLSPAGAHDAAVRRPSGYAACSVWNAHVQDLVDRHRLNTEIDDTAFETALRLFATARDACSAGRFEEAFDLYSLVPLGRPQRTALR